MKAAQIISLSALILGGAGYGRCGDLPDTGTYVTPVSAYETNAPVHPSEGETFRTDINPALLYYQSFLLAKDPMSDADWDYLGTVKGRTEDLPARFGRAVAAYDNQFRLLHQAAQCTAPCDWGIDLTAGPETLLPHLGRVKAAAIAGQLRVRWELQNGQQEAACDDLGAVFVLARNASHDGTLIGALVQVACEAIVADTVAQNFGQFSPDALQQLSGEFAAAPAPQMIAPIIQAEKAAICDWLPSRIQELQQANPNDDQKVMEKIHEYFFGMVQDDPHFWDKIVAASGGTSGGVARLIRETEAIYPRFAALPPTSDPDCASQTAQLVRDIEKAQNPISTYFAQFYSRSLVREGRREAYEAMIQAAIQYKLHGQAGLESVRDPFGDGPFQFQRFTFEGVDRGFALKSAYPGLTFPCLLIFVEKPGAPFLIDGPHAGQAITR